MKGKLFPISKVQETFWVLNSLYPENTAYHIPSLFIIHGTIEKKALIESINVLFKRHQSLRAFFTKDVPVMQNFAAAEEVQLNIVEKNMKSIWDARNLPDEILQDIHTPFDLSTPPLFRVSLYKFMDEKILLTIVFHHIIVDLYSKDIFSRELSLIYNALVKGQVIPDLEPAFDFSDYLIRHENWNLSIDGQQMLKDWKKNLPDPGRLLELPSDYSRPSETSLEGHRVYFELDGNLLTDIKNLARANSLNSFTILLTSYAIFLRKFTGQEQITIGVPFTNRRNENDQNTFGCFVNILPIQIDFTATLTGVELLRQIRQTMLNTHRRQEISFVDLVNNSDSKGHSNYNAFFQSGFTFEPPMELTFEGMAIESLPFERKGAQLDTFLTLWETSSTFCGYWEYASTLFEKSTILKWIENFKVIIGKLTTNPNTSIDDYEILTLNEIAEIDDWNSTNAPYEYTKCIHHKFEKQALISPNSVALYHAEGNLTYSEVNQKANALAAILISNGVNTGSIVAIYTERSNNLIIGILAILKAGAAYLPLGIDYPEERLKNIVLDAQPKVILTNMTLKATIDQVSATILFFEDLKLEPLKENPSIVVDSKSLAYILYTSGSTGIPKGVMIEHHSVMNRIGWMQKAYPIASTDVLIQKTPVTFDVSVWELFWWFWEGSSLVLLPPNDEKDPEVIINHIFRYKVTIIHFVPSMFQGFVNYLKAFGNQEQILSLRYIFLSGEALPKKMVDDFYSLFTDACPTLINLYGPTEATVDVSHYVCKPNSAVYIGKPIDNTGLFVVNHNNKIQPIGVPGELIITGVNLSRGYLNQPELNAEKFISFQYKNETLRAYRTGDLCRWVENGNIEYLGRIDYQVKLRGFRIELGEIENNMLAHPQIASAAVLLNKQDINNPHLVGFFTLRNKFYELTIEDIKLFLRKNLPDFMVPSVFVMMDSIPLTSSGKLDRKRLPLPQIISEIDEHVDYTPTEKNVAKVWCQVLNLEGINPNRNFFDLGGNSLLAIQVISLLKTSFDININVIAIMQYPTLRLFANYLNTIHNN